MNKKLFGILVLILSLVGLVIFGLDKSPREKSVIQPAINESTQNVLPRFSGTPVVSPNKLVQKKTVISHEKKITSKELEQTLIMMEKIDLVPDEDFEKAMSVYLDDVGIILGRIKEKLSLAKQNGSSTREYENFYQRCSVSKKLIAPVLALCLKNYMDLANERGVMLKLESYPAKVLELVNKM